MKIPWFSFLLFRINFKAFCLYDNLQKKKIPKRDTRLGNKEKISFPTKQKDTTFPYSRADLAVEIIVW